MLRVHFIKEPGVWHQHTIVGGTLDKHPPLVQGGWFDLGRSTCTNDMTSLRSSEHVPRHLGERREGEKLFTQGEGSLIMCDFNFATPGCKADLPLQEYIRTGG